LLNRVIIIKSVA